MSELPPANDGNSWFGCDVNAATRDAAIAYLAHPQFDIVIVPAEQHPEAPSPWRRLPAEIAVLVAPPQSVAAVTCRNSMGATRDSLWESVLDRLDAGRVLVDRELTAGPPSMPCPHLAPALTPAIPRWRRRRIDELPKRLGTQIESPPDAIALQAGLLQIADQLDASHELSQSIEGEGVQHAGDYWHAINHRREPDYGNAKYWFRHVGNHPLLEELASAAQALAEGLSSPINARVSEMTAGGRLDPFRFVDFVEQACRTNDPSAKSFATALQWAEMISLLEWTWKDATGESV